MPQITLTNLPNNLVQLAFTGLTDESIIFGTATVTFTGTLANGAQAPPQGETVAVTLGGVTQQAVIGPGGAFTTTFDTARLAVGRLTRTPITYRYTSDGTFASAQHDAHPDGDAGDADGGRHRCRRHVQQHRVRGDGQRRRESTA